MRDTLSVAEEEYLRTIYLLQQETGHVTTQMLAARLGVKPASASAMVKHLAQDEGGQGAYVTHVPYQGIALTARGEAVALEFLRHQRLLELFLTTYLDVPWDRVAAEAERLAPVISEDLEERIATKLGHPTRDPHGDPIPSREGRIEDSDDIPLNRLGVGMSATVVRVPEGDPALLHYLSTLGLVPGAHVTIEDLTPYGDILTLRVGETVRSLGGEIARRLFVSAASRRGDDANGAA